jgi:hypothetical protein
MEKIHFDDDTFIWKTKLNMINHKSQLLKEAETLIKSEPNNKRGAYAYNPKFYQNLEFIGNIVIENEMDKILQIGINKCKEIAKENGILYNKINIDAWVNVVLAKNPVQNSFKHKEDRSIDKYHIHTELSKLHGAFIPYYTWVYYIQMPDVMRGEDGVLYFKGKNEKEYWIRPEEDELIIMPADIPHSPNSAPDSTIDRIVFAGNVGFETLKKIKSLI